MNWIDRILEAIWQVPSVIGVEWNQANDDWYHIDEFGNHITPQADYFDRHPTWGGMRRCTLAAAGTVNHYGANPRGDGLTLDGTDGRVMVEIPKFYVKSERPSANVYRWWISPSARPGYVVHPAFVQRGGVEKDYIYVGAYEADFEYDGADAAYNAANEKLHSRTDKQPYTGSADCIWQLEVDDLANEPNIGDEVETVSETGFYIVDYLKTAGAWGGGGAGDTAIVWIRKPLDNTCGFLNTEVLTNTTQANAIGNLTAGPAGRTVTITHARTLAGNIGGGWGLMNVWSLSAARLLFYTEYAGADSQTLVGRGIVDKAAPGGFNGEVSGFDSIDTNIAVNGTGSGTGTDGLTPIAYHGIENLWGNIWQFIDGLEARDTPNNYRIINRDGSGTFANPMAGGDYETSLAVPITADGYISNIEYEDLLKYLFIAAAVVGSSSTYLYDQWGGHNAVAINILVTGGSWYYALATGISYRVLTHLATISSETIGTRLEFIG